MAAGDTVLISREEMERADLYQPRSTDTDPHVISDALLDDVEFQQRRYTNEALDPDRRDVQDQTPRMGRWRIFARRLRDPDWTSFADTTRSGRHDGHRRVSRHVRQLGSTSSLIRGDGGDRRGAGLLAACTIDLWRGEVSVGVGELRVGFCGDYRGSGILPKIVSLQLVMETPKIG